MGTATRTLRLVNRTPALNAYHVSLTAQERREFIYEHVWRPRDLVMWDNRCALHARTDFSAGERRLMRRVTILGEKPV